MSMLEDNRNERIVFVNARKVRKPGFFHGVSKRLQGYASEKRAEHQYKQGVKEEAKVAEREGYREGLIKGARKAGRSRGYSEGAMPRSRFGQAGNILGAVSQGLNGLNYTNPAIVGNSGFMGYGSAPRTHHRKKAHRKTARKSGRKSITITYG